MEIRYETQQSQYLGRKMEYKVYGHGGVVCIALPPEGARFWDWEERGLVGTAARWIDEGRLTIVTPDSIDGETFLAEGDVRQRAQLHERWLCWLLCELLPQVQRLGEGAVLLTGCGIGAGHAVNLYLRCPELFRGVIAMSGLYDTDRFFGENEDDLVFRSSPLKRLAALPEEAVQLEMYRCASPLVLCCGQSGAEQESLIDTRDLAALLREKKVPVWADEWGGDVTPDWSWWGKQFPYFLEKTVFAEG